MNNYIIIKTNDGILKFEGDLINCDIDNTSETTTVYGINKTTLVLINLLKIIPTADVEIPNNIQDVFAENRQLRALLESKNLLTFYFYNAIIEL